MIKRIFVFVVAVAMAFSASAQSEVGSITWQPNVGVTHTSAIVEGRNSVLDGAYGITLGVEAMYMLKEKFGIALGLNYTGYNVDDNIARYSYNYNYLNSYYSYNSNLYQAAFDPDLEKVRNYYFNIPVTANFYIFKGFAVKGGIAFNILSTAKIGGDSELNFGREAVKVRDLYKSVFISAPIGVSYEIKNVVFDARYSVSITNVSDYGEATYLPLSLTVGYKF